MLERQPQVSPESKFEPGEAWCANSQLPTISTAPFVMDIVGRV